MTLEANSIQYLSQGLSVFPIKGKYGKDVKDAKTPFEGFSWKAFQDRQATRDEVPQWFQKWPDADIAAVTGPVFGLFIIDLDGDAWKESVGDKEFPLTWTARTPRGGFHYYFRWSPRLSDYVTTRSGILAGVDVRGLGGYAIIPPSQGFNGMPYAWIDGRSPQDCELVEPPAWIFEYLPKIGGYAEGATESGVALKTPITEILEGVTEGQRNESMTRLAGLHHSLGMSPDMNLAYLRLANANCKPPLDDDDLCTILNSIKRYSRESSINSLNSSASWPKDLAQETFQGLAGEIIRTLEPHTEADRAALLINLLIAFSNIIGRGPFFRVGHDQHFLNMFGVLVGETSKARKGMSWSPIASLIAHSNSAWRAANVASGLSTGEGIIHAVRDPSKLGKLEDEGVPDKRILFHEEEFGRTIKVMNRETNILSAVIRQAWDSGNLRVVTKTSPCKATGAHISIIGHITRDELLRLLDCTENANGFANRFLWMAVRRSKCLPEGGSTPHDEFIRIGDKLSASISRAKTLGEIRRDAEATELWKSVYPRLSEGLPGLTGATLGRAEAQVMRLACIYALLDGSETVKRVHLEAALALWERVEDSVKYIFGTKTGDPEADKILAALQANGPRNKTDISKLFSGNLSSQRIEQAVALLQRFRYIRSEKRETAGRPETIWVAITGAEHEPTK